MKKQNKMKQGSTFSFSGRDGEAAQRHGLIWVLFLIYLAAMTWIILFKFAVSPEQLPYIRSLNLIPFHESVIVNDRLDLSEILMNGIIFVPFGIYLSILLSNGRFWVKFLAFAAVSLAYEICQYAAAIGASDITDVIMNCAGGCVGVAVYFVLRKLAGSRKRAERVVQILAGIGTVLMVMLIAMTLIYNM